jgi:hypothetical protein
MTESTTTSSTQPLSLVARIIGVITSPKATFENVVAIPKPAGVLLVVALVISVGSSIPQFTESGRHAAIEAQVKALERFGQTVTPEVRATMETRAQSPIVRGIGIAAAFVILPVMSLFFAALYWAVFNTIMGGTASYKQVPFQLMSGTMSMAGPFNLGALAPMLEEGSTLAAFLSSINVFSLWSFIVTGIGLGVLYKRNGLRIGIALIVVFLLFMFGITSLFGSFMGRGA